MNVPLQKQRGCVHCRLKLTYPTVSPYRDINLFVNLGYPLV